MAEQVEGGARGWSGWRIAGWGTAALLLLLPWVANAPWTLSDFIFMAVLLGSVGLGFELIVRKSGSLAYRLGAALAVITASLTVWVNGAVGMVGSENNPYNLVFGGVLFVALLGTVLAQFEPAGMARAMAVAAIAQGVAGVAGLPTDTLGAVFSTGFAAPWLLAAALFWNASQDKATGRDQ